MAALSTSKRRLFSVVAAGLALGACGQVHQNEPTPYEALPAGRFEIVPLPGTREVIQLDTGSGRTWRLAWSDDGDGQASASGWTALDGDEFPRAAK